MKSFLILSAILFSTNSYAQFKVMTCAESKKEIESYEYGIGSVAPSFDQACFKDDKGYVKAALEMFAKNIDSTLNSIQSLEQMAKVDKIQILKEINQLKATVVNDLASGPVPEIRKNQQRMMVGMIGQDIALKTRILGNELANAVGVGSLLGHFLPYLEENDNDFLQRTLGYKSESEVAELRDLLVDFRSGMEGKVLEYDLAVKQFNDAGNELYKVIQLIEK